MRADRLGRLARAEWGPLYRAVRAGWARRRWRGVSLTLAAVCLTGLAQVVQQRSWGRPVVRDLGGVRAEDPLWQALARTPLSPFVPAAGLPVWGALAQILVVFGIAELSLGRWRTLAVAYAATLAGTLYARLGIALGPDHPLGLPGSDARVVDTGPSAAVVGLALFAGWRHGAYLTAGAVAGAMVVEVVLKDDLAGREHGAAVVAVAVLCAVAAGRQRRSRARAGSTSGAPPSQS
ncbi:hypothetical protein [Streptomyces sp. NPDC056628]|uniref:hypothetical protein n=1 Tax=Streptomyces sp. NPDC056628 TaxID=3345882 RepID=UPI00369AECDE